MKPKLSHGEISGLCLELSLPLHAGVGLGDGLALLSEKSDGRSRFLLGSMARQVDEGTALSAAMRKQPINYQIDGLIALLLFGVFSVCVLAVLLTGADAYRRLTDRDRAAFDRRACLQYIATRVRQSDTLDGVAVADFNGVDALVLSEGDGYVTRIYCHDGHIMELYADETLDLTLEAGEPIVEAQPLGFFMEDGRLVITSGEGAAE